jgi:hypothetical protein
VKARRRVDRRKIEWTGGLFLKEEKPLNKGEKARKNMGFILKRQDKTGALRDEMLLFN